MKKYLQKQYQQLKFHIVDVPNGIIRFLCRHLKQNLISNYTSNDTNSVNLSSSNLENVINGNHERIALNIPILNSQNPFSHSNIEKFSFCLIGIPTDGIL